MSASIQKFPQFYNVPTEWLSLLVKENGTSYLLAALVLSEIKFRYNRKADGSTYFDGDALRISYDEFSAHFFQPKSAVKAAVSFLVGKGLVMREFRTVTLNGTKSSNVMYLTLNEDLLYSLTPSLDKARSCSSSEASDDEASPSSGDPDGRMKGKGEVCKFFDIAPEKNPHYLGNTEKDKDNIDNPSVISMSDKTDTEDRPTDSDNDTPFLVESLSMIEDRVDAKGIKADSPADSDRVDSVVRLIQAIERDRALNGRDRERIMSLKRQHIEAVLEGYGNRRNGKVRSPERYLRACLINSVNIAGFSAAFDGGSSGAGKRGVKKANFPEREYDFDALERRLLNLS